MSRFLTQALLFVSSFLLLNSCFSETAQNDSAVSNATNANVVSIGYIGATDLETHHLVGQILHTNQIDYKFSGSVVHYILVENGKAGPAQGFLKSNHELKGRWIKYSDLKNSP
jgi:hypothetical protein